MQIETPPYKATWPVPKILMSATFLISQRGKKSNSLRMSAEVQTESQET